MNAANLCSDLIKINSENPPGDTRDCAEYAASVLESIGIPAAFTDGPCGHVNVYSKEQDNPLLLLGHLDVVPALADGWEYPPNSGIIEGGYVHGRGATDMKGGCASLLTALARAKEEHDSLPVSVAFVCDEEGGGRYGTRRLIAEKIIRPCDCLIAEPTPAHSPCIGQKGIFRFSVGFTGNPAHSSLYPLCGTSAIMQAVDFLNKLAALHERVYPQTPQMEKIIAHSCDVAREIYGADFSSVFRQIAYNPGTITGGERENIVAQKCSLVVDTRLPWGVTVDEITAEIRGFLPAGAELQTKTGANASMTPPDSFLVRSVCESIGDAYGIAVTPMVQWAASDARALRLSGFQAIEYGPGELQTMHATNERVSVEQLNKAADIYYSIMQRYRNSSV
ncbi:MAG: M20/M25/M40 family metallo-hydrolase [Methanocorpusculum sp.]|nr:M20/M25/M40 family metallo-hydrolase [Methanocorpusculum sp.]